MSTTDTRLQIGILGAGPIAQAAHCDATRKARNAELYAICDAAEDLLQQVAAIHQPHCTYTSYPAMLNDPQVDAVIIAVADQFHVPLARQAIAAGKHVLVEKPLGITIEECELLAEEVQASGLVLQVGNNKRFDPGFQFAKQFTEQQLGQLLGLKAWYYDSFYRYTMTDNLQPLMLKSAQSRRPSGDPKADRQRYYMLTHGSHLVDTARFLGGEVVHVQTRYRNDSGSSCWFVSADFASGCLGHLDLIIPIHGDFEEGFQLFGSGGSITGRAYLPWYQKASHVECFSAADRQYHRVLGEDGYSYKRQIEGFAETILDGVAQHGANVWDGLAAMRIMVAIARSAESGMGVRPADVSGGV
ncbi:MAG: Gfo/Idh/MocA family oxidoreductase [Roseiflexaceae bacterium]